jgi:DNA replication protein DnaC
MEVPPTLEEMLLRLRLTHTAAHLSDFIAQAASRRLGSREVLAEMCRLEAEYQNHQRTERRLKEAKIGRFKPLQDFDWTWPRQIDREGVHRALQLDFLTEDCNFILVGPQGVGKTMIARNIAHQAVIAGHSVIYTTAAALVVDLAAQESARSLERRLARYGRSELLVIDEVGYLAFDARAADLLFAVVNRRYESGPIVLTTNLSFADWSTIFPGAACVTAMIDRLTHHAEILAIDADSYRHRESKERQARKPTSKVKKKGSSDETK